jgi:formylglycine-generating enzyme required for sulfatase activity
MVRQIRVLVLIGSVLVSQVASAVLENEDKAEMAEQATQYEVMPEGGDVFFKLKQLNKVNKVKKLKKSEEIVSCSKSDLLRNIGEMGHFLAGAMSRFWKNNGRTPEKAIEVHLDPKLFKRDVLPLIKNGSVRVKKRADAEKVDRFLDYWVMPYWPELTKGVTRFNVSPMMGACPEGYVFVPGNPLYATPSAGKHFCVMKYDASNEGGVAVSREAAPWVEISREEAKSACEANGPEYHLITNSEWQTVARNIESTAANWSGGVVGQGHLSRGNSNGPEAFAPTQVNIGTGINKRTHQLNTREEVWDMAGNVWKWVDGDLTTTNKGWQEYDSSHLKAQDKLNFAPAGNYTSDQNVGKIFMWDAGAVLRGGDWYDDTDAGVFAANLCSSASYTDMSAGFRCAYSLP